MAISFSYTESNNRIIEREGTSGTPATPDDFVTADRAGTADLLPATASAVDMTLTYQVRPVEFLALQISFILSGTSAGVDDTLDVTGTDWDGQAQNESIDVSGGDATYNGAYKWRTITDIDCTGWADGTLQVTQPQWGVIWDYGNGRYEVNCRLTIGDWIVESYFDILEADFNMVGGNIFDVSPYAHLRIGEKIDNDRTQKGSRFECDTSTIILIRGEFSIYDSIFIMPNTPQLQWDGTTPTMEIINSILTIGVISPIVTLDTWRIRHVLFSNCTRGITHSASPPANTTDLYDIRINDATYAISVAYDLDITIEGFETLNSTYDVRLYAWEGTLTLIDSTGSFNINWTQSPYTGELLQKFKTNIHIADKNGNNLSGVTVLCEDTNGTQVFSVSTDANGDIAEQTITQTRYYYDGSAQTTSYNDHKFTITYAGLEPLVKESITVDEPISWHLELQDPAVGGYVPQIRLHGN